MARGVVFTPEERGRVVDLADFQKLRLHLGCGRQHIDGWVNCDLTARPGVDRDFDVQIAPWPFSDNSVAIIYASHMLEHLTDPWTFFREAWRVLGPDGSIVLRMPYGDHRAAWWDLTHIRPWYAESFCAFQPGYAEAIGNPQTSGWQWPFSVLSVDLRISGKFAPLLRRRWLRRWVLPFAENVQNLIEELWVTKTALKTPAAVAHFRLNGPPANAVDTRLVMYRHHLERRAMRKDEQVSLVNLREESLVNGFHAWRS